MAGAAGSLGTAADGEDAWALVVGGGVESVVAVARGGGAGFLEERFHRGYVCGDYADVELEVAPELYVGVAVEVG